MIPLLLWSAAFFWQLQLWLIVLRKFLRCLLLMASALMPLNSDSYTIFKTNVKNLELVNYLAEGIIKNLDLEWTKESQVFSRKGFWNEIKAF